MTFASHRIIYPYFSASWSHGTLLFWELSFGPSGSERFVGVMKVHCQVNMTQLVIWF